MTEYISLRLHHLQNIIAPLTEFVNGVHLLTEYVIEIAPLTEYVIEIALLTEFVIEIALLTEYVIEIALLTEYVIEIAQLTDYGTCKAGLCFQSSNRDISLTFGTMEGTSLTKTYKNYFFFSVGIF